MTMLAYVISCISPQLFTGEKYVVFCQLILSDLLSSCFVLNHVLALFMSWKELVLFIIIIIIIIVTGG